MRRLSPGPDLGEVALRHDGAAALVGGVLEDGVEIAVVAPQVEDAGAAGAVERLDDHLAAHLVDELLEPRHVAGDQVSRDDGREVERVEFFVGIAQAARLVEHQALAGIDQAEHVRRVEEAHVEGRVLAHEDGVEGVEHDIALLTDGACDELSAVGSRTATSQTLARGVPALTYMSSIRV